MKKILFDCSSHLGQFSTSDENVRKGCKNMQGSISFINNSECIGAWNDLENGRADRTIWNLPSHIQDYYYPIMDRFYSIMNVHQEPIRTTEEARAAQLKIELPELSLYSRFTCARAVDQKVQEVHTLVAELLTDTVKDFLSGYGISVIKPEAAVELPYADTLLEERYQAAMEIFRANAINLPKQLADARTIDVM